MNQALFLSCIIFWCTVSFAQHKCGIEDTTAVPGAIFGPDRLLVTGADTIVTPAGRTLIYSCWQGQITCMNAQGQKLWAKGLSDKLIYFHPVPGKKIKGCDVAFQYNDKRIFVLNSKNGRVKPISAKDPILSLPKIKNKEEAFEKRKWPFD